MVPKETVFETILTLVEDQDRIKVLYSALNQYVVKCLVDC